MRANYKECDVIIGYQAIHLMPGQFIFGLNSASKDLRLSIQSLRTCLDYLKRSENITVQSTNKYSIITIVNWDTYQSVGDESNSQDNTIATNQQQTNNKPTTTDKKVKKEKNTTCAQNFESFWKAYPKKKAKPEALKAFQKINPDSSLMEKILKAIEIARTTDEWLKEKGQFIPYPATWLNGQRWLDEVEHPKAASSW